MKKLAVEIDDDQLKKDFDVKCAKLGFSVKTYYCNINQKMVKRKMNRETIIADLNCFFE